MAWPEGQSRLSDTPLERGPFSASQEARAAAMGHPHRLWAGIHKADISHQEIGVSDPRPCSGMSSRCLQDAHLHPKTSTPGSTRGLIL